MKQATPVPGRTKPLILGIPKSFATSQHVQPDPKQRFLQLLEGIQSTADAQELLDLAILADGTRTKVLNHLAAHFIWFRGFTAEDAAQTLTDWAMSDRHVSKDIAADLSNGSTLVADHINRMCRWYEAKKNESESPTRIVHEFSPSEVEALRPSLANLNEADRAGQAEFLLHFLRFAKRHGTPTKNGSSWDAAVHVGKVIRRWPGCSHMKYKDRMQLSKAQGILTEVKGPWHRASGPGRATTYRLSVPVVPEIEWVLTYEAALKALTVIDPSVIDVTQSGQESPAVEELTHANYTNRADSGGPTDDRGGILPTSLPPTRPRTGLDSGPRQCDPQSHAASGLHRRDPKGL